MNAIDWNVWSAIDWVFFSCIFVGFAVFMLLLNRRTVAQRRLRYKDRADLDTEGILLTYYKNSGIPREVIGEVMEVVESFCSVSALKLRPMDKFDDLKDDSCGGWDDEMMHIFDYIDSEEKQVGFCDKSQTFSTIDDLIRYMARLKKMTKSSG